MARGMQGNMAAQARIIGHDAVAVTFGATISGTDARGVALYVGVATDIVVVMESGNTATFQNVPAGTFMPILVTSVTSATVAVAADILAIY